jgi:hypothetical protein
MGVARIAAPAYETTTLLAAAMATIPEVTQEYWTSTTPEHRAEYGLPATGWGRALFGDAWGDDPRDKAQRRCLSLPWCSGTEG